MRTFFDYIYFLFYKWRGYPPDSHIAFFFSMYFLVLSAIVGSLLNDSILLSNTSGYVVLFGASAVFLSILFIYRNTEEMKRKIVVFGDINKTKLFFTMMLFYFTLIALTLFEGYYILKYDPNVIRQ
jgi:hypothetical protein